MLGTLDIDVSTKTSLHIKMCIKKLLIKNFKVDRDPDTDVSAKMSQCEIVHVNASNSTWKILSIDLQQYVLCPE